jgi:hypothetical protein
MKVETLRVWMIPATPFHNIYDDPEAETETETEPETGTETGEGDITSDKSKASKIKLDEATQKHVNSLLATERRKAEAKNNELIKQLETQKNLAGTSRSEKERLEARIDELRLEFSSKEEISKKEVGKKLKTIEAERDLAKQEAANWKNLFQKDRVQNALLSAATEAKAYNPRQVVELLTSKTRLVEVMDDDNKPIPGQWTEKVTITSKDKDGKDVVLDLPATEAVKQLSELPEYGNLFISGATGGLGGVNFANRSKSSDDTPPTNTTEYMAWRRERRSKGLPV